jgi:hypothetical protein
VVGPNTVVCLDSRVDCIAIEAEVSCVPVVTGPSQYAIADGLPLHSPPSSPIIQSQPPTIPLEVAREAPIDDVALPPGSQNTEAIIQGFLAEMRAEPVEPTLRHPPPHHHAKARVPLTVNGLPWRSAQVAAQGRFRVFNPEVQAQNPMMRKWDITSPCHSPDAEALESYNAIYRAPLGSSHRKAIRALFTACPIPLVNVMDFGP